MASQTSQSKHHPAKTPRSDPLPSSSASPPATLHPTTHLDPGAYVRGTHPLNISSNTLIHPRSYLLVIHAPLNIGSNTVIYPKATVGAPPSVASMSQSTDTKISTSDPTSQRSLTQPTSIGSHVQIHSHATIHISSTVSDYCILESHVTIHPNATIGAHSKICAGITIPPNATIPEWTVVYGDGQMRRPRKPLVETQPIATSSDKPQPQSPPASASEETTKKSDTAVAASLAKLEGHSLAPNSSKTDPTIAETHRLAAQNHEREATANLLRNNARIQVMARQKAGSRESMSQDRGR